MDRLTRSWRRCGRHLPAFRPGACEIQRVVGCVFIQRRQRSDTVASSGKRRKPCFFLYLSLGLEFVVWPEPQDGLRGQLFQAAAPAWACSEGVDHGASPRAV